MKVYLIYCKNCNDVIDLKYLDQSSGEYFMKMFPTKENAEVSVGLLRENFKDHPLEIREKEI